MRLKRHYSVIAHSPDVVELRHGTWNPVSFTFTDESGSGRLFRILNRMNGTLTIDEIAAGEGVQNSEIETILAQLGELGVVENETTHALDYYLDHIIPNLVPYEKKAEGARPSAVIAGDRTVGDRISAILTSSGLCNEYEVVQADAGSRRLLSQGTPAWLLDGLAFEERVQAFASWRGRTVVFATNSVNPLELQALNRVCLYHRIPWIHATMDGPFLLIGPTIVPFRSPCYECLEARVLMNLRQAESYQGYKRALVEGRIAGTVAPLDSVLEAMLASLTSFEVLNFLLTKASFTVGKMLSIYLPTMEFTTNEVLRLPGCPACSPAPERDNRELNFDVRTLLKCAD